MGEGLLHFEGGLGELRDVGERGEGVEAVLSCRVLGGHWGCCSPALPSLGWRLGGAGLSGGPPPSLLSPIRRPPHPHGGGC